MVQTPATLASAQAASAPPSAAVVTESLGLRGLKRPRVCPIATFQSRVHRASTLSQGTLPESTGSRVCAFVPFANGETARLTVSISVN